MALSFLTLVITILAVEKGTCKLYAFMGDTQVPWACEDPHWECKEKGGTTSSSQSSWSNSAAFEVLNTLGLTALVINGDLTAFGHQDEFETFESYLLGGINFYVFLGLGNHDYSNNVNDCVFNNCAKRMCDFMLFHVENTPAIREGDYSSYTYDWYVLFTKDQYTGSLAYWWLESVGATTIAFFQLHNHATYETDIDSDEPPPFDLHLSHLRFKIRSSLPWLEKILRTLPPGQNVIINQHWPLRPEKEDADLVKLLRKYHHLNFLAILFAHDHLNVGFGKYGCENEQPPCSKHIRVGKNCVPLLYSGSVPYNKFLVMKFRDQQDDPIESVKIYSGSLATLKITDLNIKSNTCSGPVPDPEKIEMIRPTVEEGDDGLAGTTIE